MSSSQNSLHWLSPHSAQEKYKMRMRVLIIDDHPDVRSVLCDGFKKAGYEVTAAIDGNQGIQLFRAHCADLVITDILMPGKDGLEFIRELRNEHSLVKIIAMSGGYHVGLDFLPEAQLFGAVRSLAKPFSFPEILAVAEEIIREDSL